MYRIARSTAVLTMVAVVLHCSLPALAASEARIDGTVEVPCDPSRVAEVALVHIRPVSGDAVTTVLVDPTTGKFNAQGLTDGEYDFIVIGGDGEPLTPEPTRLVVHGGVNAVVLSMEPPGCGEQASEGVPAGTTPGEKKRLKDWQLSLIYVGVVGVLILAMQDDDDERPASPSSP